MTSGISLQTLTDLWGVSIASGGRQVHGPAKRVLSKEAITLIRLNPIGFDALTLLQTTTPPGSTIWTRGSQRGTDGHSRQNR
jgi:hypothetical protein